MKNIAKFARRYASNEVLKKTALYDFHVANQGTMVPFAGYYMPILYKDMGIKESHMWCRENAAIFDVSHMGQIQIYGEDRYDFIESLVPGNIKDLKIGSARLTAFTNENGGILDDCIITRKEGHIYMVVNAACVDQDLEILRNAEANFDGDASIEFIEGRSLVAIQGPKAAAVIERIGVDYDIKMQNFMTSVTATCGGIEDCYMARLGYTGEDGWEVSVPDEHATAFAEMLLAEPEVELNGLAPRDTLRLEAGLCLYGSDMNPELTPIESNLRFTIGKRRREEANFPGADIIVKQWAEGCDVFRIGFMMDGRRVAREHYKIFNMNEKEIGEVTSGTLSPVLDKPIGMGYVPMEYAEVGTKILVDIRGKLNQATICEMPFVEQRYYRAPK